jgi:hypothetical protein
LAPGFAIAYLVSLTGAAPVTNLCFLGLSFVSEAYVLATFVINSEHELFRGKHFVHF